MITLTDLKTGAKYEAETYTELSRISGFKRCTIVSVANGHTNSYQFEIKTDKPPHAGRQFGDIKGPNADIAQIVRDTMRENNFTVKGLARLLGCSNGTMEKIANGWLIPSGSVLKEFCLEFNISADYVLGLTDDKILYK